MMMLAKITCLVVLYVAVMVAMSEASPAIRVSGLQGISREKLRRPLEIRNNYLGKWDSVSRSKRMSERQVECIDMLTGEGNFFYAHNQIADGTVCGAYLFAPPDVNIEVGVYYLDVPCENNGLVAIVDGWEMNGEVFPNPLDHPLPMKKRFREFCGGEKKTKHLVISSQNVALIQFRMPHIGASLGFTVRYVKNPAPCNVLLTEEEVFTVRNYGKSRNCSVATVNPAAVSVLDLNVGVTPVIGKISEFETGTIHKVRTECQKRGLDDYVQIGGSPGLDNANIQLADAVCGLDSKPERRTELIECEVTSARLVSSGAFDNSVTIYMRRLKEDDPGFRSVTCLPEDILK